MSSKKALVLPMLAAAAVPAWLYRRSFTSKAMLLAAHALPNSAKKHNLGVTIPIPEGSAWIKPTLHVDIGDSLSEVVGYRIESTAFSHYGGFKLSRTYSDFVNPDSEYYQAWVGAYYVFDGEAREHYGFDEEGELVPSDALDLVEADQRMALGDFGCPNWFPDGRRLRLNGELTTSQVERRDGPWWRVDGKVETWSGYHRGKFPEGKLPHYWGSGVVPADAAHPVDNYHPLTLTGSVWLRYRPKWRATCGLFYVVPEYVDNEGRKVTKGLALKPECESIMDGVTFKEPRPPW